MSALECILNILQAIISLSVSFVLYAYNYICSVSCINIPSSSFCVSLVISFRNLLSVYSGKKIGGIHFHSSTQFFCTVMTTLMFLSRIPQLNNGYYVMPRKGIQQVCLGCLYSFIKFGVLMLPSLRRFANCFLTSLG